MQRRYVILAMAGMLALGLVTPVLGKQGANLALERAKKAKRIGKSARDTANQALTQAQQANGAAQQARTAAEQATGVAQGANEAAQRANTRLDEQKVVSAREPGLVTTTQPIGSYEALGGPSVTVTVPPSGLIEVWAEIEIKDDDGGAVGLYEDGNKVPGISEATYCGDDSAVVVMEGGGAGDFAAFSTPPSANPVFGCTSTASPAPILLERPPGTHTYELRYSECICGGEAEFQNRLLKVAPRP